MNYVGVHLQFTVLIQVFGSQKARGRRVWTEDWNAINPTPEPVDKKTKAEQETSQWNIKKRLPVPKESWLQKAENMFRSVSQISCVMILSANLPSRENAFFTTWGLPNSSGVILEWDLKSSNLSRGRSSQDV